MINDIDLSSYENWIPIGENATYKFTGGLDGAGFTIRNITIDRETEDYVGLFGYASGTICNLNIENISIKGNNYVGGVAGNSDGDIINVNIISGSVTGNKRVGGIAGRIDNSETFPVDTSAVNLLSSVTSG